MPTTDQKIDDLARMMAQGFSELREDFSSLRGEFSELKDTMATKADLEQLRGDVEIMLDKHIGVVRADYDALAGRVKTLEMNAK